MGLMNRPPYAEPYQQLSQATGQPLDVYERGLRQSFKVPNGDANAFLAEIEGHLTKRGFVMFRNDADDTMNIRNYRNAQTGEAVGVTLQRVSFEDMIVSYTLLN